MNSEEKPTGAYVSIPEGSQVLIVRDENDNLTSKTDDNKIDFWIYWHTISKYKWAIFVLTLLIGLLTALITFSLQPIYRSTALLLIEFDQAKVISIEEIYGISSSIDKYYQTQLKILTSRTLVEKVVNELNLVSHPVFDPATQQSKPWFDWHQWLPATWLSHSEDKEPPKVENRLNGIVNAIKAGLSITPMRESQLVEISFESPNAQLAAQIPNTLADIYIKSDLEAKLAMTEQAAEFLTQRTNELRQELSASEKALQAYMEKENLVNVAGIRSVAIKQIEQTTSQLVNARQQLTKATNVYRQVQQLRGYSSNAFESIPAVLNHPLVQSLKTAELEAASKIAELREHYGDKHPKMIAKQAELNMARANTTKQIELVVDGITKEYEIADANVRALEQSLEMNKKKIEALNRKEYQLRVLQRDVEVNRQLYDLFLTRFKETNASQDVHKLQSTVGRVIELALVAATPYKPQKKRIVVISLVLGFLFATLLAFLLEYLDNTLKDSEDVEQKLGLPLLGSVPKVKGKKDKDKPQWLFLKEPKSPFSEAIRTIRTGIMLSGIDAPQKVLVITSSVAGEGKTTLAISQAFALGQMDKTLLIEADMRRPSIAQLFGLNSQAPGLSELVAGTRKFEECIRQIGEDEEGGIEVIVSGTTPPNPLELLASKHFEDILGQLSQQYKYIIIDSAPTMPVSDASMLAKYASEVIYVVKANATPYQIVREGIKRLRQVKAPVNHVVLNQLLTQKSAKYHYSKYAYYKNYYSRYEHDGYTQS